jgi:DNA polymerase-3 subunit alpha
LVEREKNGPYTSIIDFLQRVDGRLVNKRAVEALIKSGAFDNLKVNRFAALDHLGEIMDLGSSRRGAGARGQAMLFEVGGVTGEGELWSNGGVEHSLDEILKLEKEVLGLFITDHPARYLQKEFEERGLTPIAELPEKSERSSVSVGGIITSTRKLTTKAGDIMMVGTMEDVTGTVPFVLFPVAYRQQMDKISDDGVVILHGNVDRRREELQVIVERVEPLKITTKRRVLHIQLDSMQHKEDLGTLRERLLEFPGEDGITFHVAGNVVAGAGQTKVAITPQLLVTVEELVGEGGVWIDRS